MRTLFILSLLLPSYLVSTQTLSSVVIAHPSSCSRKAERAARLNSSAILPDNDINVSYYRLNLRVSTSPALLSGIVTVRAITVADSINNFTLNLSDAMTVDSVLQKGFRFSHVHYLNGITIALDRTYTKGETFQADIFYHGVPNPSGFGSFEFSANGNIPWVWSLSEPYGARDWWPCKDHPSDKADSADIIVTCPTGLRVASNGRLLSVVDNADGTSTHYWAERYPIASYLISVAITNYFSLSRWFKYNQTDSMEVLSYVVPESLASALPPLSKVVGMLTLFSRLYGLYPFIREKYGNAQFGASIAMEHQTMTSTGIFDEITLAHELAHQWFGDLITCANWQSLWLNEGFATYSEALYQEATYGPEAYQTLMGQRLDGALHAQGTLFVQDTTSVHELFANDRVYSKGATVLHMLRHMLGDTLFFRALQAYVADPRVRFGVATTDDFRRACESVTGKDLRYFFNEWVFGEKYPQYRFRWQAQSSGSGSDLIVSIDQVTHTTNPVYFIMPLDVRCSAPGFDTTLTLFNNQTTQSFTAHLSFTPVTVKLDPDKWVLKELLADTPPLPASFALEQNYPNPFNPGTTITFGLPHSVPITLTVYNILGERVRRLIDGRMEAGTHSVIWDGRSEEGELSPSGVYYCRLAGKDVAMTVKMIIVR